MKIFPHSRRAFLRGAGGALLSAPLLSSLASKALGQDAPAAPPVRYVQWITNHGQWPQNFWPAAQWAPTEAAKVNNVAVAGVKARALSSITGPMSQVLSSAFDPIRAKMNLISGLDLMVAANYHNASAATCGSWPREDNYVPAFSYSVDVVLETSKKIYPTVTRAPALRLAPGLSNGRGSFSWTTKDGKPFKLPAIGTVDAAITAVYGAKVAGTTAEEEALNARRLTDLVLEDYRRTSNLAAISGADKQLLSNYMDLLADAQGRATAALSCTPPEQLSQSDFDALHKSSMEIGVAALLCGATRVLAYHCYQGSPTSFDETTFHSWAHTDAVRHGGMSAWRYKQLALLIQTMDSITESNGKTLLDNSMLYAGNELSDPGHGKFHLQNMPIITAGGAGGKLITGQYIDFGKRLLNNMLVTIFSVMGLAPADYERNGAQGFGDYTGKTPELYTSYVSAAEKRKPLPYLFKG